MGVQTPRAASAFAELVTGEQAIRAEMASRIRARSIGGGAAAEVEVVHSALASATPNLPQNHSEGEESQPSSVRKPSDQQAAAADRMKSVLALRKSQVGKAAAAGQLRGLHSSKDSDDEEDEAEDADTAPGSGSATFDRLVNLLGDPTAASRQAALQQLCGLPLGGDQRKSLLRPLLLRFADPSERCRELAASIFEQWVEGADVADVSGSLPFLLPVLVERLGTEATAEPSEELRSALVSLTTKALFKVRALLRPYVAEIGSIVLGVCRDNYPPALRGACALMVLVGREVLPPMVKSMGGKAVQPYSARLIEAVLPHLHHRHSSVRVAVLEALEHVLLAGAGQSVETLVGWRMQNNVPIAEFYGKGEVRRNHLADLSRDSSVAVRSRFLRTLERWVRDMAGEDLYEQEVRLYPYLCNFLVDDAPQLCSQGLCVLISLGEAYLEAHEDEYRERVEYGHAEEVRRDEALNIQLPHPFAGRPPLGARVRVRNHFRALVHPIVAELSCWTAKERLQSASLLEVLLVFVEGHAAEFGHLVLPALAKAAANADAEPELVRRVCSCARVLAHYVDARSYLPLLLQMAVADPLNTLSQRTGCFTLLPPLLRGMYLVKGAAAEAPSTTPATHALAALSLLCSERGEAAACAQHTPLRTGARATLRELCALYREGRLPPLDGVEPVSEPPSGYGSTEKLESAARELYATPPAVRGSIDGSILVGLLLWHGSDPALSGLLEQQGAAAASAWGAVASSLAGDVMLLYRSAEEAPGGRPEGAAANAWPHLRHHYTRLRSALAARADQVGAPAAMELLDRAASDVGAAEGAAPAAVPAAAPAAVVTLSVADVESFDDEEDVEGASL